MGFGFGFSAFRIMFVLVFGIVIVRFIVTAVRGISTWNKNNHSPRLTVAATVAAKRQNTSVHHHHSGGARGMHTTTSTAYYVTFQLQNGERLELRLSGSEYGLLAEGDSGELTFQGTRYLGFDRQGSRAYEGPAEEPPAGACAREKANWDPER